MGGISSKEFSINELSASMAIKKIKILGAIWELPAEPYCQSSPFTSKLGQIGLIGSAVLLAAPKWLPGF
jgi:hypothetical protein